MRLRLPFFLVFLLSISCLYFVDYNSFRTFEVSLASAGTHMPAMPCPTHEGPCTRAQLSPELAWLLTHFPS